MRRGLFLSGLLCFLSLPAVMAAQQTASGAKAKPWAKLLGFWKQVPDDGGGVKVEPEGANVKFGFGCKQDGSCSDVNLGNYDGKRYKDSANPMWDSSFRKTGNRAMQQDDYTTGNLSQTVKWQLSSDANTLTRTSHSATSPRARDISSTYERSGGPTSNDDLFVGFWKRDWNKSDAIVITYAGKGDMFTFTSPAGNTDERDCDGKDHPNANLASTLYSCSFPDERTYELVLKRNGRMLLTRTTKVSEDGKRMVRITKDADGKLGPQQTYERIE